MLREFINDRSMTTPEALANNREVLASVPEFAPLFRGGLGMVTQFIYLVAALASLPLRFGRWLCQRDPRFTGFGPSDQ